MDPFKQVKWNTCKDNSSHTTQEIKTLFKNTSLLILQLYEEWAPKMSKASEDCPPWELPQLHCIAYVLYKK